jgi:hypothetical protein
MLVEQEDIGKSPIFDQSDEGDLLAEQENKQRNLNLSFDEPSRCYGEVSFK